MVIRSYIDGRELQESSQEINIIDLFDCLIVIFSSV